MRIDVHSHLIFLDYLEYLAGRSSLPQGVLEGGTYFVSCQGGYQHASPLGHADVDAKLRSMEELGIGLSVLSHGMPGPELLGGDEADSWAARINDHLASVVSQYPDKFAAWATLGWGSAERTIEEIDRCVKQLGFVGIYLFSNIHQKTLDDPAFRPVFKHVARLGVPMNMHPTAPLNMNHLDQRPLIPGMAFMFDTSLATIRMIMSGLFEEEPDLKLIVPHTGGFVPYIRGRVERLIDAWAPPAGWQPLSQPAGDYFDKIYVDTVAHSPEALAYCYERYGPEKLLYGTDHPFAHFNAYNVMVDHLACTEAERELINRGNAERLLGLPKQG
jgi:predicted TIM-barrel fold metal-dependent hydrolase